MRSLSILCLFTLIALGHSRSHYERIAQLLQAYRRAEENSAQISYDFPATNKSITYADLLTSEGAKGYIYLQSVMDQKYASQNVFVNLNGWPTEYSYEILPEPTTSSDLISQLLSEGYRGYRLKRRIFTATGYYNAYVKNSHRSDVQYAYQYFPLPSDPDVFWTLLNEQGAQGYRFWGFYNKDNRSALFINDLSQGSANYNYAPLSDIPKTATEFLEKTNDLGEQGYRFAAFSYIVSQTQKTANGKPVVWNFILYCRDQSQYKTYRYKTLPLAASIPDSINQLKEQADQGYLFVMTPLFGESDWVNFYLDWETAKSDALDIDGGF